MGSINNSKDENFKLQRAVESSDEAIFITDLDGLITYINPGFTKLYGYSEDEITGKTTPRILKSGMMMAEDYKHFWATILSNQVVRGELINKTKDGRFITVEGSANPILNDRNEIIGFIGIQHDISLRKKTEEALLKSEEMFRKALKTSPDSINISRLSDGMIVSVNEAFTKIFGYSEEESIGKTSIELNIWADKEKRNEIVNEIKEKGKVESFEAIFLKKDGGIVNGLVSASVMDLDGVPHILTVTKDISIRLRVEERLAKEQFLVNALMENLPDHIYFKDTASRFIRVNKAQSLFFGLIDPSLAIGKTDFDFFTGEHAQQAYDDEKNIILTGKFLNKIEKETHPVGPDTWVSTIKLPLRDETGNIIGTFGISRDITEQKKSEEKILILANALKSINECVSITDMSDNILFLNQAFINTYGFNEDDLKEENISLIRSTNNPPEISENILPETLKGGWHGELLNCKKDGSEFIVSLSTSVVRDSGSEPVALIGVANDITERKRLEIENIVLYEITKGITNTSHLGELLKLMHASLSKVVYAENCFVALYDQKTNLFSFPYFVDKFDRTPLPSSMGKSCASYVFRTARPFIFTQGDFKHLEEMNEVELVGSTSPSWIGIPLQTPSKIIGVLVLQHYELENVYSERDERFLTSIGSQIAIAIERKVAEEEIKLKNEMLQGINAEKDKFFSILAHDLRGPLSAFVAATQIITEEIQTMELEEIREITASMKSSASNIYSLLENLLEWSRLQRGVMDFIPVRFNLKEKIIECTNILSESARKKMIEIGISIEDDIAVFADKHMFETVVRNLVSNALKFTRVGGNITVTAVPGKDNSVEIKITDSGIGMTTELKSKLFKINEKSSRPGTEGEPSTGLGLLLCKEFIEKNGGRIWVESEVGKGSTFAFTIKQSD